MPTYRYRCGTCGDDVEIWQSITDDSLTTHDAIDGATCDGPLTKVLSPAGIVLKGSGFYKTDNRTGGSRSTSGSGDTKSGDSSSDSSSGSSSNGSSSKDSGSKDSGSKDSGSKDSGSKDSGSKAGSGATSGSSGSS